MSEAPALTRMRHELIRAELARSGGVRIRDLVVRLGVSRATVRRDLHALVDAGEAVNARGGALLPSGRAHGVAALEREAIAAAAADAILTDQVKELGLFGGPLVQEVARRLAGQAHLHVVTNSLAVARILAEPASPSLRDPGRDAYGSANGNANGCGREPARPRNGGAVCAGGPQVTLLAGALQPSGVVLGGPATDSLATLRLDATYVDCAGFDPRLGASVDDLFEAQLRRLAIQVCDRAVLLVERAGYGRCTLGSFAAPGDLHAVIDHAAARRAQSRVEPLTEGLPEPRKKMPG